MNSLRGRLTISYAIVVAGVLVLVSVLACRIAFEIVAHPAFDAFALGVARAQSAAAASRDADPADAAARVVAAASGPGVVAFAPDSGRPPREPGFRGALPPGGDGPPPDSDGPPSGPRLGTPGHVIAESPLLRFVVGPFLGLKMQILDVRGRHVLVGPDFAALDGVLREFGWIFLGSLVVSVVVAWTIAASLANHAVAPLIALTHELERFSAGDLAPRVVTTSERSELGALIAAYNGAAAQVTSAFNERLEVEQHMRRFIADAGHELRTPLTVIGGYLEILRKGGIDDLTTRERALTTLTAETRRMRTLIDRLLALARLDRPDVSELLRVDVEELIADAIAHVHAARGGDISLTCPSRVVVFADPAELAEAIENVIDNAVKYGRQSAVAVRVETAGGSVVIRVTDGGGGIPPAERGRLFERFFRGDDRGEIEGTGLGLAIAERAISRCGGRIELEDGRPGSTTFAFTMPIAARGSAQEPLRF